MIRDFNQQAFLAQDQLFRTMNVSGGVIYLTSTGQTKNIAGIFDAKDGVVDDGFNSFVAPQPIVKVKSAEIINKDRDSATFTILGTEYRPDKYIDDGRGMTTILLRAA
jgi:hypothetical protein